MRLKVTQSTVGATTKTGQTAALSRWDDEGGAPQSSLPPLADHARNISPAGLRPMPRLTELVIDESEHSRDGLVLRAWDQVDAVTITAFISRRVIDEWVRSEEAPQKRMSLFRAEYTALGKRNLHAIQRIVAAKYQHGTASSDPHPFVDVLLADITDSGEALDIRALT
jgi:hypothetical protein